MTMVAMDMCRASVQAKMKQEQELQKMKPDKTKKHTQNRRAEARRRAIKRKQACQQAERAGSRPATAVEATEQENSSDDHETESARSKPTRGRYSNIVV